MDTAILPHHISLINSNSDSWQDFNSSVIQSYTNNIGVNLDEHSKLRKNLHEFNSL